MKARIMNYCGTFILGSGAIEKTGDLCEEFGLKGNAVLVNDEITWKVAGERISELLKEHGFREVDTTMVEKGAVRSEIDKVREKIGLLKPSVVFGIGGGVNMDIAKAVAFLEEVRYITVPTIFATDAMSTVHATFRGEGKGVDGKPHKNDYRVHVKPMLACIVDSDIIKNAPWRFQAAGFADYLTKLTALRDWDLAYSQGKDPIYNACSIALAKTQIDLLMKNAAAIRKKEERAFEMFLQVLMSDGWLVAMAGNVRILAGSEHIVAQALMEEHVPGRLKALHGEECSLGTILMTCWQGGDWKAVKKALERVGAPVTAKQLELDDEAIIRALVRATTINRQRLKETPQFYTILLEKPLSKETAEELARKTGVIK